MSKVKFFARICAFFVVFCCCFSALSVGQQSIRYASLSGTVTERSEAVIPHARIVVTQRATNQQFTQESDSQGRFSFVLLPSGKYDVRAQAAGFAERVEDVELASGAAFNIVLPLNVAGTSMTVDVSSEAPVVETARTQLAGTISSAFVDTTPLNGRNYLDLALLVPGVSPTNTASTQLFAETSAVAGQGISINGQRNFSNNFVIDGLSANDDAAGLAGAAIPLGAVEQMQVVTSGGQAEYGHALGGYASVITKSGTNAHHGEIYGLLKNRDFNAANALTAARLPMTQTQYGASFGGAVIPNRTFYFGAFEQNLLNQDGVSTASTANVAAINSVLAATQYPGPQIASGLYRNPVHATTLLSKIDHSLTARDQLGVRYSFYNVGSENSRNVGGLNVATAGAALYDRDHNIAFSNVLTVSSRTVNETRGQFTSSNLRAPANDPLGPAVTISGVAAFGTASGAPTARADRGFELVNNLLHQGGAHTLRVGGEFLFHDLTITYPRSLRGSYSFASLANFQKGIYSTFTQTFGDPEVAQTNPNFGYYVQDEWRVSRKLTVNLGVRHDLQFLRTIATDTNNISPRVGIAWAATPKTVVRVSAGMFYDRVPLRPLANALLSANNTSDLLNLQQKSITLSYGQAGAPVFPNILSGAPAGTLVSITTMDRHLPSAYSEQMSVEVERQIGKSATFSVSGQHVRGIQLLMSINQNVPQCSSKVDPVNLCRPAASYQNNSRYSGAGDSQYDALNVSFVQRATRYGAVRVNYTYSKAMDDVGEFFFSAPLNNFNVRQDWGRSDDDQRHRVVLDGYVQAPSSASKSLLARIVRGTQVGAMLQYYSPLPLNALSGASTVQLTNGRPCAVAAATCAIEQMIGRNASEGFDAFTINARATRTFAAGERVKVTAGAEVFNLLNRRNNLVPNATFGSGAFPDAPRSTFRQATAVGDARSVQLTAKVVF